MENQHERKQGVGAMSKSMLIVMVVTMGSKIAGALRETVLASQYGMTVYTDAYKTALLLPCLVLSIIVTALSATLIPAYSSQLKLGRDKADRFINNLFSIGLVFSVVILLLTAAFMKPLVNYATASAQDPKTAELAYELAMIMVPMGVFVFLARITSAYLQANFNFAVPAISQLFLNIVIIAAIMLSQGANILYVAIGTVIGWAVQFLFQIPSMRRTGLRYRPVFDFKESGLREVCILLIPVLISSAFDQVYLFFDNKVAYLGNTGDPTALDYANRVSTMVSSVLLTTIATVLFPNLVRTADNKKRFSDNLSFGINLNLLIALPAMLAILILRVPITRFVYERGEFTSEGTYLTSTLLACYSAGILGVGLREVCNRSFYAFKETITPTIVGVSVVVLNIGLNYALHPIFGAAGIAAATAISSTISGFVLLSVLQRKKKVLDIKRVVGCLWKTAAATAAMGLVLLLLYGVLGLGVKAGMSLLVSLLIACVAGVAVYAGVLILLRVDELHMALNMIKSKLKRG